MNQSRCFWKFRYVPLNRVPVIKTDTLMLCNEGKRRSFYPYSWNSEVEATWRSLIGWPLRSCTVHVNSSSISILLNGHRTECKLLYVEQLQGQFRVLCCSIHTTIMKIHIYRKVCKQKFKYCIYSKSPQSSQMTNFLISFAQTWQTWGFSPVWVLDILIVPSS